MVKIMVVGSDPVEYVEVEEVLLKVIGDYEVDPDDSIRYYGLDKNNKLWLIDVDEDEEKLILDREEIVPYDIDISDYELNNPQDDEAYYATTCEELLNGTLSTKLWCVHAGELAIALNSVNESKRYEAKIEHLKKIGGSK